MTIATPGQLSIRCFGGVAIEREGVPIVGRATQRRRLALMLLLAASPDKPVSRDRLVAYLWPETDAESARHLLSVALYELRKVLGDEAIVSRGDDLWLDPKFTHGDVAEFERAMTDDMPDSAIALYRGAFADGFHLSRAPELELWVEETRQRYRRAFHRALENAAVRQHAAGDARGAADTWLRLAAEDPSDARVLMQAMLALDAAGNRAGALRQAAVYEAYVRAEFGAEPSPEVRALAESLRRGGESANAASAPIGERAAISVSHVAAAAHRTFAVPLWAGVVAAALLIGAATSYFVSRSVAAPDAKRGDAAPVLAVLPFRVQGNVAPPELGASFADVLTAALDGAGLAFRAVRGDSVRAYLRSRYAKDSADANSRAIAAHFGADLHVTGTLHPTADGVRVRATLLQSSNAGDSVLATAEASGTASETLALADAIAIQLLAARWSKPGDRMLRSAARSTSSVQALKAFVAGEADFHAGRFATAAESFERAVAADSAFAVGYYRLSMATLAADLPMARANSADERAKRFAATLVESDRLLLRAYDAFRQGDAETAEQLYTALVSTYPHDVEAWRQLGETFFHYNPLRGRAIAEARASFERVLAAQPDNRDALWHLALLELHAGDRQRGLARFDALAALHPGASQSLELRTIRALASRDRSSNKPPSVSSDLARADELQLHQLVWRAAVYLHDMDAAEAIARLMIAQSRPRHARMLGHRDLAVLELARGRWRAADAHLKDASAAFVGFRETEAVTRALFALNPVAARPGSELRALRDTLIRSRSTDGGARSTTYVALLGAALGDTTTALSTAARLERIDPLGALTIRAAVALRRRDARAAARQLEMSFTIPFEWFGLALSNPHGSRALERFLYAEALRESGRSREALGWYASFGEHAVHDLPFLAPAHLRMAQIHEQLGDDSRAMIHYGRFVELWGDCDPELRPLRDQATARLASLRQK